MEEEKKFSRQLVGKTIVSKSGKRFGEVGDIIFETKTGELIHMVVSNPTQYAMKLDLERDNNNNILIPFSSLVAVGDFMVIAEEDII
ncbi:MAG TPA: PRC-barrel domain-containing protein [Candidatus Nanoarchaeia archaeon]|nr:PRC-barrel domain-containing protein [Candidatus Nanoarchaeia archaeon]